MVEPRKNFFKKNCRKIWRNEKKELTLHSQNGSNGESPKRNPQAKMTPWLSW